MIDGDDQLPIAQIPSRAVTAAAVVALQGMTMRALGLAGTIVTARLLVPRDFGIAAIGLTLVIFGNVVADGGVGAALLRRPDNPSSEDYAALLSLQLSSACALALIVTIAGLPFGTLGLATAIFAWTLPLVGMRGPAVIAYERRLNFRPLAIVQVAETIVYVVWTAATAALGWGVWSLVSGAVVKVVAGNLILFCGFRGLLVVPKWSSPRIRPLLGFGLRYQGIDMVNLVCDEGQNILCGVLLGTVALGLFGLAGRLLQIPYLLFSSLWRVSYPAMARIVHGDDIGALLGKALRLCGVATGAVLVPLVSLGPGTLAAVFGPQWRGAWPVIPWACIGLIIGGPVSVACSGYLFAKGEAGFILRVTMLHTVLWFGVAIALSPWLGVGAFGVGWMVSSLSDMVFIGRRTMILAGVSIFRPLVMPVGTGLAAALIGMSVCIALDRTAFAGLVAASIATISWLVLLVAQDRALVRSAVCKIGQGLRSAIERDTIAAA